MSASETADTTDTTGRLMLPLDWLIDDHATATLHTRLRTAAPDIAGVVAPLRRIACGSSGRVESERLALAPHSGEHQIGDPTGPTDVAGGVLVRGGIDAVAHADHVTVSAGPLLVVDGVMVHDPWHPLDHLTDATAQGRSPFPWRPVVVLLALDDGPALLQNQLRLVNSLIRLDVEARLAVPAPPAGLHLTAPCSPTAASIAALQPDIIIALDPDASAAGAQWAGDNRSTIIIEVTQSTWPTVEIVPWDLARAQGRVRARVSRLIEPPALAALIRRLCSGPQVLPPTLPDPDDEVVVHLEAAPTPAVGAPPALSVTVVLPPRRQPRPAHFDGLLDRLAAAGHHIDLVAPSGALATARTADLVFVTSAARTPSTEAMIRARADASLPTVLAVSADETLDIYLPEPLPGAMQLALSPSPTSAERLRCAGWNAIVVPTLVRADRVRELQDAAEHRPQPPVPVLLWRLGSNDGTIPDHVASVTPVVLELLADLPEARVDVITSAPSLPKSLRYLPQLTVRSRPPDPADIAGCTVQLWTPTTRTVDANDDCSVLVEASLAGVPTVLAAPVAAIAGGVADPESTVADPRSSAAWRQALRAIIDEPQERERRGNRAREVAESLAGIEAGAMIVDRFLGWVGNS